MLASHQAGIVREIVAHSVPSIDIHNHVLAFMGLVVGPTALPQHGTVDVDRLAALRQGSNVSVRSAYGSPRRATGDTGRTIGRHRPTDSRLGFVDD